MKHIKSYKFTYAYTHLLKIDVVNLITHLQVCLHTRTERYRERNTIKREREKEREREIKRESERETERANERERERER